MDEGILEVSELAGDRVVELRVDEPYVVGLITCEREGIGIVPKDNVTLAIVDTYRTMFESRISAGANEKLPCAENPRISSWSDDRERHAKKASHKFVWGILISHGPSKNLLVLSQSGLKLVANAWRVGSRTFITYACACNIFCRNTAQQCRL